MAWVFLIIFAGKFVINDTLLNYGLDEDVFGSLWILKWPLIGNILGGLIALVLGPFQFWEGFRNRYIKAHRYMGMVYITGILIGTISSINLALTTAIDVHWTLTLALIGLAVAWISTTGMAFRFILLRRIQLHKEWMVRSYVVTFAFVLFRWLNESPYFVETASFIERGSTLIWISWVVPLFITEIILQWNKK
ncbi:DUF2306 domain-containing protein [Mongoliibacter sp.]|uniref:DUF2306 domain-containing protein n=1 Tax=Mongoliibacter sp. TaxID=2022438 RepID=UPI0025E958D9|nr:DUF2306 domain-containing protein [Mongoliibacter sp.]